MKAEDFIELIEQNRFDKISKNGMTLIAERFRELQSKYFFQLTIPVVSDTLILTPNDAELFFNEIMNPKDANEALKKAMLKFITR